MEAWSVGVQTELNLQWGWEPLEYHIPVPGEAKQEGARRHTSPVMKATEVDSDGREISELTPMCSSWDEWKPRGRVNAFQP